MHTPQAYYLIRAAQQREELQAEAAALRGRIAAAERDEAALVAAVGQLLDANDRLDGTFRRSSRTGLDGNWHQSEQVGSVCLRGMTPLCA